MQNNVLAWLLTVGLTILLVVALKYGVIGARGVTVDKKEHPVPYWMGVILLIVIIFACALVGLGLF